MALGNLFNLFVFSFFFSFLPSGIKKKSEKYKEKYNTFPYSHHSELTIYIWIYLFALPHPHA